MNPILPSEEIRISDGSTVLLHFEVSLPNGAIIDSTFGRNEPVSLTIGDESLLSGFEQVLINLKAGDTRTAHLPPKEAFGDWNAQNVQSFPRAKFNLSEPNPVVGMMMEFSDQGRNTLTGVVCQIGDDEIKVDFNHPLAGQDVVFKVQIFKVTPKGETGLKIV